jgi:hypothetical protein
MPSRGPSPRVLTTIAATRWQRPQVSVDILLSISDFVVEDVFQRSCTVGAGNPAESFTDEEVPHGIRHFFPSALRRAYAAADATMEREPYLGTPGGKYQRGDLIMLAASFELERLVKSGHLPFDGVWEYFARPTGKHFVMLSQNARITTSQLEDSESARATPFSAPTTRR